MAKNREEKRDDPARVLEIEKEGVELRRPTMLVGVHRERGESVDVFPFERRHMVDAGYVEGDYEDIASEAEKAQGNLDALIPARDREDLLVHGSEAHYEQSPDVFSEGEGAVTAPEDPNASNWNEEK